jgi:hypothetical protein
MTVRKERRWTSRPRESMDAGTQAFSAMDAADTPGTRASV